MIGAEREVHVDEVLEEDRDDLAEPQRHDREVVAAQSQRRRAEQHAEQRPRSPPRAGRSAERQVDAPGSPPRRR